MWTIRRHVLPILLASAALLAGCTEGKLVVDQAKVITNPGPAKPAPYKIGKPYQVNGVWYYPKADYRYSETGIASWYGPGFHGKRTANGEVYDENGLTAAHKTLPMPAMVRVTNLRGAPRQHDQRPRAVRGRARDRHDAARRPAARLHSAGHGAGARRHHAQESQQLPPSPRAGRGPRSRRRRPRRWA
jgi:rare lipoprotein A